jgi:hypothetical protein
MSWKAKRVFCRFCMLSIAVRPLTGRLFRHGAGAACPGSDKVPS